MIYTFKITRVMRSFGILERIPIRSYVFATVGTVERPFPVKTYHYPRLNNSEWISNGNIQLEVVLSPRRIAESDLIGDPALVDRE